MNATITTIIISFAVLPILVLSYQLGTPSIGESAVGEYLKQPALTTFALAKKQESKEVLPRRRPEIADLVVDSSEALAWDLKQNVTLFSKNSEVTRPIASLTKLITAAVVLDYTQPRETVAVSLKAIRTEGNSGNLKEGEVLTIYDLLAAALLESSNDAAYALAEYTGNKIISSKETPPDPVKTFVRSMNQKFNDLGLVHTNFTDPSGLADKTSFSTAEDFSRFIKYLRDNQRYLPIWEILKMNTYTTESQNGVSAHEFRNTNPFLAELSGVIGGKTGYTPAALGNMALVMSGPNGTEIIYLVLGSADRFGDIRKMVGWVSEAWVWPAPM
ncbi:MAG: serine hydrolase [Patescibacteria group bacterium]